MSMYGLFLFSEGTNLEPKFKSIMLFCTALFLSHEIHPPHSFDQFFRFVHS